MSLRLGWQSKRKWWSKIASFVRSNQPRKIWKFSQTIRGRLFCEIKPTSQSIALTHHSQSRLFFHRTLFITNDNLITWDLWTVQWTPNNFFVSHVFHRGERIVFWPPNMNMNSTERIILFEYYHKQNTNTNIFGLTISLEYEYTYFSVYEKHRIIRFSIIFSPNYSNIYKCQIICSPLLFHLFTCYILYKISQFSSSSWK